MLDNSNGRELKSAGSMLHGVRMSSRPEFYSGRGAKYCDLNGKQLVNILNQIEQSIGEEAVNAFIQLVDSIKVLSATDFMVALYALERNGWKLHASIEKNPQGEGSAFNDEVTAFCTVMSVFGGFGDWDDTDAIKIEFLRLLPDKYRNNRFVKQIKDKVNKQSYSYYR
jgi:hypothetical protein